MLKCPFIAYADFECSPSTTNMSNKIARHEPNSAATYFVCTFDNKRNQYKCEGWDCVLNMIEQLRFLAPRCVKEQQENAKLQITVKDNAKQEKGIKLLYLLWRFHKLELKR